MINLTEEQNELVMGMMEGFGDKTLQVAGFKIDVEEEVQFAKKIGEGSFGIVYVGKFRGMQVAVKQLISDHVDEENLDR
jgi:predicted Ser/Thr protein kinase